MSRISELAAVLERAGIGPDYDPAQLSAALERSRVVVLLDEWAIRGGDWDRTWILCSDEARAYAVRNIGAIKP